VPAATLRQLVETDALGVEASDDGELGAAGAFNNAPEIAQHRNFNPGLVFISSSQF